MRPALPLSFSPPKNSLQANLISHTLGILITIHDFSASSMNIVAQIVGFAPNLSHFYYSLLAKIKGFSVLL